MNYHTAKWSEVVQQEFSCDWNIPYNTPLPLPMPDAVVESTIQIQTESRHLNCASDRTPRFVPLWVRLFGLT